jgi:hypothetical protein
MLPACAGPTPTPTPTPTTTIGIIPYCARQDLFFYNASSDISGYKKLKNQPELDGQRQIESESITSSSGEKTLGTWIMDSGEPGIITLAPGSWDFRSYFLTSSDAGKTFVEYRVFNQTANGTKTWLWFGKAIEGDLISGTIPKEYGLSYARRNFTQFFTGDRLGVQVNVSTNSASARTVKMELAGNTNTSMVSIAYFLCNISSTATTPITTTSTLGPWQPDINPSINHPPVDYIALLIEWWWLPALIAAMIALLGRRL